MVDHLSRNLEVRDSNPGRSPLEVLTGKPTGRRPLGREGNVRMDLEENVNAKIGLIQLRMEITGEPM